MSSVFKRAQQYARQYLAEQESNWREIIGEQDKVMIAYAGEVSVAQACYALEAWFRSVTRWHEWVSEDIRRYDETDHKEWKQAEQRMITGAKLTSDIIQKLKDMGHKVAREQEFNDLAKALFSATEANRSHQPDIDFHRLKSEAVDEHRAGATEEIAHWGE